MNLANKILLSIISYSIIACGSSSGTGISGLGTSSVLSENFTGTSGANWPSDWTTVSGVATITVDLQSNRGRLQSNSYNGMNSNSALTRVVNNTVAEQDVDVTFTVEFGDFANQGVGFYVRQNGGYLTDTTPNGQGYAVFWEGNGTSNLGLWYEINGVEVLVLGQNDPIVTVLDNTRYQIRYQVEQVNATNTTQRARVWLASDPEPSTWNVETTTTFAVLQNISGGIAVDLFNYNGTSSIYLDDIVVKKLN